MEGAETESLPIRIADVHGLYYDVAFRSISQLCCKDIAKAWIKICHPRKQTSHPYNGGKSSNVEISLAEYGYKGHFTKPDYWPSDENWPVGLGCRHVEPDHVKKPGQSLYEHVLMVVLTFHLERLLLLLYLIRIQYKDFKDGDFTLEKMRQSTEGIHLEFPKNWTTKCVERLKEIYRIRETEMEFERGEIGECLSSWRRSLRCANTVLDADTLVYPQMPKPRCKAVRKAPNKLAPKLGIKAASAPSEQLKNESEDKSPGLCNTPGDEDLDLSEGSESSTYADTSSSTKEISLDESYAKRISCDARTIQDGLPFSNSPSPMDRIHNPVQENWTLQTANLGRDTPIMTQRNSFGCVATPGGAQRSLPLRDQHGVGSSSMQTFPSQEVRRRRYDHDSAASQQAANRMRPNGRFTRAPAARLVAPKVETICPQTFAASSSGLVGAFPTDTDYSSWQNLWNAQLEPSMYTAVADPSASLIPSTNGSFSSGYSDASFSSGLHSNGGSQNIMPPYQQGFDEEFLQHLNLQRISIPGYQPLGVNTPSSGNPDMSNRYPYTTDFHTEHKFDPFSQHQRQL